jgi:hypothetical protein
MLSIEELPVASGKLSDAQKTYNLIREAFLKQGENTASMSDEEKLNFLSAFNTLSTMSQLVNNPDANKTTNGISMFGRKLINFLTKFKFSDPNNPKNFLKKILKRLPDSTKNNLDIQTQFLAMKSYEQEQNDPLALAKSSFNTAYKSLSNALAKGDSVDIQVESNILQAANTITTLEKTPKTGLNAKFWTNISDSLTDLLKSVDGNHISAGDATDAFNLLKTATTALTRNDFFTMSRALEKFAKIPGVKLPETRPVIDQPPDQPRPRGINMTQRPRSINVTKRSPTSTTSIDIPVYHPTDSGVTNYRVPMEPEPQAMDYSR